MENLQVAFLTKGETTLEKFFLWVRNVIVKHINKQWVVQLPAGSGTATVRDSDTKVTIDLSNFVNPIQTQNSGGEKEILKPVEIQNQKRTIIARTLVAGANVTLVQNVDTIQINATGELADVTIATENLGSGEGVLIVPPVFADSTWTIQAQSIAASSPITVNSDGSTITITFNEEVLEAFEVDTCAGTIAFRAFPAA